MDPLSISSAPAQWWVSAPLYFSGMAVAGALSASFLNVVAWRSAQGRDWVAAPSGCDHCGRQLRPWQLIPVLSWAAQKGRCPGCKEKISRRHPLVELCGALLFGLAASAATGQMPWNAPQLLALSAPQAWATLSLCVLLAGLGLAALTDHDSGTIPDGLNLPLATVLVALGALGGTQNGPTFGLSGNSGLDGALLGAASAAGLLAATDLWGSLLLRRGRERKAPEWPIGYQQMSLALGVGSAASLSLPLANAALIGLGAALLSATINGLTRRVWRAPEWLSLGLALAATAFGFSGNSPQQVITAGLAACGMTAFACGLWWWGHARWEAKVTKASDNNTPADAGDAGKTKSAAKTDETEQDFSTLGFGDIKLMLAIGAGLGLAGASSAFAVACIAGSVFGIIQMRRTGNRMVRFAPWLLLGSVVTLSTPELQSIWQNLTAMVP